MAGGGQGEGDPMLLPKRVELQRVAQEAGLEQSESPADWPLYSKPGFSVYPWNLGVPHILINSLLADINQSPFLLPWDQRNLSYTHYFAMSDVSVNVTVNLLITQA